MACICVYPVNAVAVAVAVLAFAFIYIDLAGRASVSFSACALVGIHAIDTVAVLIACHTYAIVNVDFAIVAVVSCKAIADAAACETGCFAAILALLAILGSSARIRRFAVVAAPTSSSACAGVCVVAVCTGTVARTVNVGTLVNVGFAVASCKTGVAGARVRVDPIRARAASRAVNIKAFVYIVLAIGAGKSCETLTLALSRFASCCTAILARLPITAGGAVPRSLAVHPVPPTLAVAGIRVNVVNAGSVRSASHSCTIVDV